MVNDVQWYCCAIVLGIACTMQPKESDKKLNATRVIKQLWPSTLEEFLATWHTYSDTYVGIYHQLTSINQIRSYVDHCTVLHQQLLTHLFIQQKTHTLFYSNQPYLSPDYQSLQAYCKEKSDTAYWLWYALYYDCLSYLFIDQLCPVLPNSLNEQRLQQAEIVYNQMSCLIKHLEGSPYQKRYTQQLQRYQELLTMARSEV